MNTVTPNEEDNDQIGSPIRKFSFSRMMRKRYGIGMLLVLALWPLLGFWKDIESILVNGMLLDTYQQLGFVAFLNSLAWFFCISMQRLLNTKIPGWWWTKFFGDGSRPWGILRICLTLLAAAITPLILAFSFGSEFPFNEYDHTWRSLVAIAIGLALGLGGFTDGGLFEVLGLWQ